MERGLYVGHWELVVFDDAPVLREFLQQRYGTDFGISDDELAARAEETKARIGGLRLSWKVLAAQAIKDAYEVPKS